jgi:hypothetical protein
MLTRHMRLSLDKPAVNTDMAYKPFVKGMFNLLEERQERKQAQKRRQQAPDATEESGVIRGQSDASVTSLFWELSGHMTLTDTNRIAPYDRTGDSFCVGRADAFITTPPPNLWKGGGVYSAQRFYVFRLYCSMCQRNGAYFLDLGKKKS